MPATFTEAELEAYLDEALAVDQMSALEVALRDQPQLVEQLTSIIARRDAGVHSLGEVWRRARLSCPGREQLGSYLLGALSEEEEQYFKFHLEVVRCRYCQANLADLDGQQADSNQAIETRQRRYFQSSAGYLRTK
ncbi:MAG: hypothetical protein IID44_14355 [Planctomycetes bacterium]|nr:hypothetical protein [Planctomycetota bacterium]